ncbi:MAG: uroporphyrinogen decarboxylase [Hyphomicrobiaceae bacterium]|nr:uroporphyrinogen decarboxylase [Hyphomicrobiaceae bacterium]
MPAQRTLSERPERRMLRVFAGQPLMPPPIWLMRQAGRYLPEYRKIRAQARDVLELCYTPELAAELTLQPVRRFDFDAAIVFADILVVPDALNQTVRFLEGEGPRLEAIGSAAELARLKEGATRPKFQRVFETVARVRQDLPRATALIGFCGAPWTVATYMVGGGGSVDQAAARLWAYRDPQGLQRLISLLEDVSVEYLSGQIDAGADLVQIFDSWAGSLPDDQFRHWVIAPTRRLVDRLKERHPGVPVIGFPRGAGPLVRDYAVETGVDGVSCDWAMPLKLMAQELPKGAVVQGNLDPLLLLAAGPALERRVRDLLSQFAQRPFIFNLGHGIQPQTPPENVARLVGLVRGAD